jgi:hypothetical protein
LVSHVFDTGSTPVPVIVMDALKGFIVECFRYVTVTVLFQHPIAGLTVIQSASSVTFQSVFAVMFRFEVPALAPIFKVKGVT